MYDVNIMHTTKFTINQHIDEKMRSTRRTLRLGDVKRGMIDKLNAVPKKQKMYHEMPRNQKLTGNDPIGTASCSNVVNTVAKAIINPKYKILDKTSILLV